MKKLLLFCLCWLITMTGFAQQPLNISGTVRIGNEPAPQATVQLNPGNIQKVTNDNGYFRFPKTVAGNYEITITIIGYQVYKKKHTRYR